MLQQIFSLFPECLYFDVILHPPSPSQSSFLKECSALISPSFFPLPTAVRVLFCFQTYQEPFLIIPLMLSLLRVTVTY